MASSKEVKKISQKGRINRFRIWPIVLVAVIAWFLSGYITPLYEDWRADPPTEEMQSICSSLSSSYKDSDQNMDIWLPKSKMYIQSRIRYHKQTALRPACVAVPKDAKDVQYLMKLIAKERIPFAVSSGQHHSNIGFSSIAGGLQIDLRGLNKMQLSKDKKFIDLGSGLKWIDVYRYLQGTGVQVVGGRTMTVGVGGFLAGGGGMGWSTNRHGMTANTAIEAELVTPQGEIKVVSRSQEPDLFWAIRGGGNRFGIVTRWRLETHSLAEKVYAGMRIYPSSRKHKINQAIHNFLTNNTDSNAQIILSYGVAYKLISIICIQIYYPNENPGDTFKEFDQTKIGKPWSDNWGAKTFVDSVTTSMSEQNANQRSLMDEQNFEHFQSMAMLDKAAELSERYGKQWFLKGRWSPLSHSVLSLTFEPFHPGWGKPFKQTQGVYPYDNSPMPLLMMFYWNNERDDEHFTNSARLVIDELKQIAISEGQNLKQFPAYPNYAQADRKPEGLYGAENWKKLQELRSKYDPENVMGLTNYFF